MGTDLLAGSHSSGIQDAERRKRTILLRCKERTKCSHSASEFFGLIAEGQRICSDTAIAYQFLFCLDQQFKWAECETDLKHVTISQMYIEYSFLAGVLVASENVHL